jgi:branched-chain amino acid transport system ATP-binding protein
MGWMLEVSEIHTYYGESHTLHGVSLKINPGQVVALLGRNGMGKTTTIRSIIGFTPARQGTITFKGVNITRLPSYQIARMGIGLIPQGRHIFPSLSVEENLTVAARGSNRPGAYDLAKLFTTFPILKERAKVRGTLLSGGEQQMLAIGRALMSNPELLLMDEPSEGLAPIVVKEIAEIIRELKKEGISILLVEQNFNLACTVADYTYVINKGAIVRELPPHELMCDEEAKTKYLGVSK